MTRIVFVYVLKGNKVISVSPVSWLHSGTQYFASLGTINSLEKSVLIDSLMDNWLNNQTDSRNTKCTTTPPLKCLTRKLTRHSFTYNPSLSLKFHLMQSSSSPIDAPGQLPFHAIPSSFSSPALTNLARQTVFSNRLNFLLKRLMSFDVKLMSPKCLEWNSCILVKFWTKQSSEAITRAP